jgi:hypothetical protein
MKTIYNVRTIFENGRQKEVETDDWNNVVNHFVGKIERNELPNVFEIVVTKKEHNGLFFGTTEVFTAWEAKNVR